jgi:SAM-dependent methyltransferase
VSDQAASPGKRWRIGRSKGSGAPDAALVAKARLSGDPFKESIYFEIAEPVMDWQLERIILPLLDRYQNEIAYTAVLDFAAGYGRNSAWLKERAKHLTLVDINKKSIVRCQKRFAGDERFTYIVTDGASLTGIASESITLLYTFDSMVHFGSDVVQAYLPEFKRVLKSGCYGFCHHSHYTANPGGDFRDNPHWRNFMSKELFAHMLVKAGLEVVEQQIIDWGEVTNLDCVTLFRKPKSKWLGIF